MNHYYLNTMNAEMFCLCDDHAPKHTDPDSWFVRKHASNKRCEGCEHEQGRNVWGQGSAYDAE